MNNGYTTIKIRKSVHRELVEYSLFLSNTLKRRITLSGTVKRLLLKAKKEVDTV